MDIFMELNKNRRGPTHTFSHYGWTHSPELGLIKFLELSCKLYFIIGHKLRVLHTLFNWPEATSFSQR